MTIAYSTLVSDSLHIPEKQVRQTIDLLESGATLSLIHI